MTGFGVEVGRVCVEEASLDVEAESCSEALRLAVSRAASGNGVEWSFRDRELSRFILSAQTGGIPVVRWKEADPNATFSGMEVRVSGLEAIPSEEVDAAARLAMRATGRFKVKVERVVIEADEFGIAANDMEEAFSSALFEEDCNEDGWERLSVSSPYVTEIAPESWRLGKGLDWHAFSGSPNLVWHARATGLEALPKGTVRACLNRREMEKAAALPTRGETEIRNRKI